MRDFAKKMMRFPLAVSLYGIKHLAETIVHPPMSKRTAHLLQGAEEQLVRLMRETFKAGDRLTEEAIDPLLALLTQDGLQSGHVIKTGFDLTRSLTETLGGRIPGSDLTWREFANKLESFATFRYVESALTIAPNSNTPLSTLVERATGLDPYLSVWAIEGLGHYAAERAWQNGEPQDLLTAEPLPNHSTIALHAGLGLSLAKRCFAANTPTGQIEDALRRFVDLCEANARPGCFGISFEALGLVAQTFMPELRLDIDRQISKINTEWLDFFWHGVGRGAYFVPRSSVSWRVGALMPLRPPHDLARKNVISGLAWPLALVNIRHPEIVARFVSRHGRKLEENTAFANGIGAALAVWFHATGGDAYFKAFGQYTPTGSGSNLLRRWQEQVQNPAQTMPDHIQAIQMHGCFEAMFRNQPLNCVADPSI